MCEKKTEWEVKAKACLCQQEATITIPEEMWAKIKYLATCEELDRKEFSMLFRFERESDEKLVIKEWYVPKQDVAWAHVTLKEEYDLKFNGCLHKHPDNITSFSGTDEENVIQNFPVCLLFCAGDITDSRYRDKCPAGMDVDRKLKVFYEVSKPKGIEKDLENIGEEPQPVFSQSTIIPCAGEGSEEKNLVTIQEWKQQYGHGRYGYGFE